MTYYIEIRKRRRRKRKAKSWESNVIEEKKNGTRRIEKLKDGKDAGETIRSRTTKKITGIRQFFL